MIPDYIWPLADRSYVEFFPLDETEREWFVELVSPDEMDRTFIVEGLSRPEAEAVVSEWLRRRGLRRLYHRPYLVRGAP